MSHTPAGGPELEDRNAELESRIAFAGHRDDIEAPLAEGNIGVLVMGNFEVQQPAPAQVQAGQGVRGGHGQTHAARGRVVRSATGGQDQHRQQRHAPDRMGHNGTGEGMRERHGGLLRVK